MGWKQPVVRYNAHLADRMLANVIQRWFIQMTGCHFNWVAIQHKARSLH